MRTLLLVSFFCAMVLTFINSCSYFDDPKKADEKNFTEAINTYLSQESCILKLGEFPYETNNSEWFFESSEKKLKPLVEIGFLTRTVDKKKIEKPLLFSRETKTVEQENITYNLTEEGKKYYKGDKKGFYYGSPVVNKIVQFSEPADLMGKKISEVRYTYSIEDLQKWVQNEKIWNNYQIVKSHINSTKEPIKDTAALILTNKGWKHERIYAADSQYL